MTFLTRKIERILDKVAMQQRDIVRADNLIEHHYSVIKQLKRKQNKSLTIKDSLNENVSIILLRVTDKEKYKLLRGVK